MLGRAISQASGHRAAAHFKDEMTRHAFFIAAKNCVSLPQPRS
jgi:hypothetical protein